MDSGIVAGIVGVVGTLLGTGLGVYVTHELRRTGNVVLTGFDYNRFVLAESEMGGEVRANPIWDDFGEYYQRGKEVVIEFNLRIYNDRDIAVAVDTFEATIRIAGHAKRVRLAVDNYFPPSDFPVLPFSRSSWNKGIGVPSRRVVMLLLPGRLPMEWWELLNNINAFQVTVHMIDKQSLQTSVRTSN